jgi:hypothetical protein
VGFARTGLTGDVEVEADLEQTRRAIEGVRALLPVLDGALPDAELTQYRAALAELQLAYSRALAPPPEPQPQTQPETAEPQVEAAERPKIWTPRGDV